MGICLMLQNSDTIAIAYHQNLYYNFLSAPILVTGCQGEFPVLTCPEERAKGFPNLTVMPDTQTLHPLPQMNGVRGQVGQVLCVPYGADGAPMDHCPRQVALNMLQKLDDMGYSLLSSFEMEFQVQNLTTYFFLNHHKCAYLVLTSGILFVLDDSNYNCIAEKHCSLLEYIW